MIFNQDPLYLAALAIYVVPVVIGLFRFKQLNLEMRLILLWFFLAMVVDWFAFGMMLVHKSANWTRYYYIPVEYAIIAFAFSRWSLNPLIKRILVLSIPVFIAICILSALAKDNLLFNDNLTLPLSCLLYAIISLYTLISLINENYSLIYKNYIFWICAGLLLYSVSGVIFYSLSNYYPLYIFFQINTVTMLVSTVFYSVGLLCYPPR
jgi:hypothetical protein